MNKALYLGSVPLWDGMDVVKQVQGVSDVKVNQFRH